WGTGLDSFFDQLLVALGDTNKDGKLSDAEWNAKGKKVELYVGAIDPSKLGNVGYGQTGGGHQRKDIDSTAVWNDTLMKDIIQAAHKGETRTLTWTFWATDSKGNVWLFAERMS
ncbi:MAG: hypothetical protein N2643_00385, partial [Endomicrobia bacterium]|nr:hypothetical protein [Endomicrobiia bacterium]